LGTFHGHQIFVIIATFSAHISGFISCHFYSFSTQALLLLPFLLFSLCLHLLMCFKVAFLLLLGSFLLPTSLLLLAAVAGVS
jgi:hypothetical protein